MRKEKEGGNIELLQRKEEREVGSPQRLLIALYGL